MSIVTEIKQCTKKREVEHRWNLLEMGEPKRTYCEVFKIILPVDCLFKFLTYVIKILYYR